MGEILALGLLRAGWEPDDLVLVRGATGSLRVSASGDEPLSFQWLRNGVPLEDGELYEGTASGSLTIRAVTNAVAAIYHCRVHNGIGVAAMLAVLQADHLVHPPLQLLFTVDEETGLTGAKDLDPAIVTGRIMLNLDTEEDGALYMGCAGGADTDAFLPVSRRRGLLATVPVKLAARGLRGGHSGLNIIENRGNAIKLATRVLQAALYSGIDIDVVSIDGGSKHNAIPREAHALIWVPEVVSARLEQTLAPFVADVKTELKGIDDRVEIHAKPAEDGGNGYWYGYRLKGLK